MRFHVLGPVAVSTDEGSVPLPAKKERTLLALLLATAGRETSPELLAEELWQGHPPPSAGKTLQTYVSHLRKSLGTRLVTRAGGYALEIADDELDARRFERLVAEGRLALLRGDRRGALRSLSSALDLWTGAAYSSVDADGLLAVEAHRLEELRRSAEEDLLECRVSRGEHVLAIPALEALVREHPLREHAWALLMRALDGAGRQAEALRAFQRARTHLVEEIGVEPGPELARVEQAILRRDGPATEADLEPVAAYVQNADGRRIAYWTTGAGQRDVVFCAEVFHNLELLRELDEMWAFLEPLARGARLIAVQRRGTGLSDRDEGGRLAPPEDCVGDIDAVLDAVGSSSASLVGWGHGGQVALAYAAARPDRVRDVAVVNAYDKLRGTDEQLATFAATVEARWGTSRPLDPIFDRRVAADPDVIRRVARVERLSASPHEAGQLQRQLAAFDIDGLLPNVRSRVLVVHLTGSITGAAGARALAERLPAATYVEGPGAFIPRAEDAAATARLVTDFFGRT